MLDIVRLPTRFVESVIAASVALAASNNVWPWSRGKSWLIAFGFGLIHGFGLSTALRTMGLHGGALLRALFGFNIGVEIGQLLIVLPLFPLVLRLQRSAVAYAGVRRVVCGSVAAVAMVWFVVRLVG